MDGFGIYIAIAGIDAPLSYNDHLSLQLQFAPAVSALFRTAPKQTGKHLCTVSQDIIFAPARLARPLRRIWPQNQKESRAKTNISSTWESEEGMLIPLHGTRLATNIITGKRGSRSLILEFEMRMAWNPWTISSLLPKRHLNLDQQRK
jgi:hypothetical protein